MDFRRRLTGLQEKMVEVGIDLVVYGSCQNFQYLTGLLIDWRHGIDLRNCADNVFVPKEGEPIITLSEDSLEYASQSWIRDVRLRKKDEKFGDLVKGVISDLDLKGHKVGLGDHVWGSTTVEVAKAVKNSQFHPAEALMDHLRMIKDLGEIERLRKVAAITDKAVEEVIPKIRKGITQHTLEAEIEYQGRKRGASDVSFSVTAGFVKAGSEVAATPFTYPREKGLVAGTSIAFDVGYVMDGYCSDFGRSFYYGPVGAEVAKGYEALQQGILETVDKMHSHNMHVCDLFPALEKTLDRLGYGDYLRARVTTGNLGHNIGVEVHEPPWLSPAYKEPLQPNMVMALEPKLWHAGEYYLRVEDIVLMGPRKAEFLTNFDRELFQL